MTAVEDVAVFGNWIGYRLGDLDASAIPPPELYLREFRDTDPADPVALAELIRLGPIRHLSLPYEDLPVYGEDQWWRLMVDENERRSGLRQAWEEKDRRGAHERLGAYYSGVVHASEVSLRVRVVNRLAEHAVIASRDGDVADAWPDSSDKASSIGLDPTVEAWRNFTRWANAALRDFHVRVYVDLGLGPEFAVGGPYPSLYSVAILQLTNDLAGEVPYRECANETCRRVFYRHRGRSQFEQHHATGVKYCSHRCAKAQGAREHRRRQREARNGEA